MPQQIIVRTQVLFEPTYFEKFAATNACSAKPCGGEFAWKSFVMRYIDARCPDAIHSQSAPRMPPPGLKDRLSARLLCLTAFTTSVSSSE